MLASILFSILLALYPNLRVLRVYSYWLRVGVAHRMMAVRELPPRDDLRILVRGELRYGIWADYPAAMREMTWVRKKRDLLMCLPSLILSFRDVYSKSCFIWWIGETTSDVFLVWLLTFSLPARSIKFRILSLINLAYLPGSSSTSSPLRAFMSDASISILGLISISASLSLDVMYNLNIVWDLELWWFMEVAA